MSLAEGEVEGFEEAVALMLRGVALGNEGRWDEALACLDDAVAKIPWLPLARLSRARALCELQRYEQALDDCDYFLRYVAREPLVEEQRCDIVERGLADCAARLARSPDDLEALFRRGNLYMKTQRDAPALADYAAVLERDAGHADALNNRGNVLYAQGRHAEAAQAYAAAAASAPQRAALWFNLGNLRQAQGRLDAARSAYRQALALSPQFAEAHLEVGHCALSAGDFASGWREFEWRWRTGQMSIFRRPSAAPLWLGGAAATRQRTLLVWAEQGAGDTLQFVRFVPQLVERFGRVVLRVQAPLLRLIARLAEPFYGRLEVLGNDQPLPPHDLQCPLMSLPLALGITSISAGAPYLRADAEAVKCWDERLGARRALRVGLVWAGRQFGQTNSTRDVALARLAPLAKIAVDWASLQKEVPPADAPALAAWPRLRVEALGDYADTAALIANLDLVIAVDTSVAHLAAALGQPCWLMLRHSGEWRWQRERADSPWYPTLRILRQRRAGDWEELVERLAGELARYCAAAPN